MTNTGNTEDTVTFTYAGNDPAWTVRLPVAQTTLAARAGTNVTMQVDIPTGAAGGAIDTVVITATSQGDPNESAASTLTTTVKMHTIFLPVVAKNF